MVFGKKPAKKFFSALLCASVLAYIFYFFISLFLSSYSVQTISTTMEAPNDDYE